jgi:acyl-CoA synthetase (AMP-forming)/AMP-acid ligase II
MAMDLELATNLIIRVNVGDSLTRTAGRLPDQLAIVDGDRTWTYPQLNSRVNEVANSLMEKSVYAADPRVAEAVVVGLPHPRWTEAITAVVTVKPGEVLDEAELIAAVKTPIAGFKAPKSVIAVDELPRTSTGRIQKNVLRQQYVDHYA